MSLLNSIRLQIKRETGIIIISESESLSGGSIHQASRLDSPEGPLFIKWNSDAPAGMFEKEARGLDLLRKAETGLVIPEVIFWQDTTETTEGFLLMRYIQPRQGTGKDAFRFGQQLAGLHSHSREEYGLTYDNYIGSLHQSNGNRSCWRDFFIHERIEPLLSMAFHSGIIETSLSGNWERLKKRLPSLFPDSRPSLLHGDLWSGNYFFNKEGQAVLIDPAVYYGHPEMELSFTRMFGGFPEAFYKGYESVSPLADGFTERVDIYNLYPLLVHVNLFGGHYASRADAILKRY